MLQLVFLSLVGLALADLDHTCYPNGTISVTHPSSYSHCFAVQDQGLSSAVKCSVSTSGSVSIITGCSQDNTIVAFFSQRSGSVETFGSNDYISYEIECSDIADSGVDRTVSNLLGATCGYTCERLKDHWSSGLSFALTQEVHNSHELFVLTKWTNQVLFGLVYHGENYNPRSSIMAGFEVGGWLDWLRPIGLEVTTQDAVTPSFAISSALRDPDQLGSPVYEELVGEEIYWTIDIPSDYSASPTCYAYSGSDASGSPSKLLVQDGCSQDSDILGGDFNDVETSIPLINRYYVNLYVFKFYNSDNVFFKCTVKLCPSGSSACDISCGARRRRNVIGDELKGDEKIFTTSNIMHILPASSATSLLGSVWLSLTLFLIINRS